ncbi:MAG: ribonuclease Z [Promethearchaeota archaeon]
MNICILFLGTAGSLSTPARRLPAIALVLDDGNILLFDCGEDVQRAFQEANLKFNKPIRIFITHMHGDHVIGLPGLLFRFEMLNRSKDVDIFGPPGIFFYLLTQRFTIGLVTDYAINVHELDLKSDLVIQYPSQDRNFDIERIEEGIKRQSMEKGVILDTKRFIIKVLPADHTTMQSFTYIFEEKPLPGKFNPERARELGIPRGPLWGRLQKGEILTLRDGRIINPFQEGIIGPLKPGKKIVISGDTRPTEALKKYLSTNHVNVLVHEATFLDELKDVALEKKHTTVFEAATLAKEGFVDLLILTHFSARYSNSLELLESEAKKHFKNTILAHDNFQIKI